MSSVIIYRMFSNCPTISGRLGGGMNQALVRLINSLSPFGKVQLQAVDALKAKQKSPDGFPSGLLYFIVELW